MSKKKQKPLEEIGLYELLDMLIDVEQPIQDLANGEDWIANIKGAADDLNDLQEEKANKIPIKQAKRALDRAVAALNKQIIKAEAAVAAIPEILQQIKARRDKLVAECQK